MYTRVSDFLRDWKEEWEFTQKMLSKVPAGSFETKFHPKVRSLGTLLWHITVTLGEMFATALEPLNESEITQHSARPETPEEIARIYGELAKAITEKVSQWSDEYLLETRNMYGEIWELGRVLAILITHQAHHRGQLSVLYRLAEIPVNGFYGPSQEEWALMGREAME